MVGVAANVVFARVAPGFFQYWLTKPVDSNSPVILAIAWALQDSIWLGPILGAIISFANTIRANPLPLAVVRRFVVWAGVLIWSMMMRIMLLNYAFQRPWGQEIDEDYEGVLRFIAVSIGISASYYLAAIATLIIVILIVKYRPPVSSPPPLGIGVEGQPTENQYQPES
jgi:hypothetical protein